jgi:hypothetical protein
MSKSPPRLTNGCYHTFSIGFKRSLTNGEDRDIFPLGDFIRWLFVCIPLVLCGECGCVCVCGGVCVCVSVCFVCVCFVCVCFVCVCVLILWLKCVFLCTVPTVQYQQATGQYNHGCVHHKIHAAVSAHHIPRYYRRHGIVRTHIRIVLLGVCRLW